MTASKLTNLSLLKRSAIKRRHGLILVAVTAVTGVKAQSPSGLRNNAPSSLAEPVPGPLISTTACAPSAVPRSGSSGMKRSVSFGDTVRVIQVLQPIDESMKNTLFYCRSDYRRFKKESKRISNMLDQRLSMGSSSSRSGSLSSNGSRHRSLPSLLARSSSSSSSSRKNSGWR